MTESRLQSNLGFRLMSLMFRLRDMIRSPSDIIAELFPQPGMAVLDFGCGTGSFSLAAARLVGPAGRVYALDIHRLAIQSVQRAAAKQGFTNIQTISGSAFTELGDDSIDIILLYDVLHAIAESLPLMQEMRRVLKSDGVLSVSDHHLHEEELIGSITAGNFFRLANRGSWSYVFKPTEASEAVT
jgi:ubiquinone/menaquinone biosynthesis C-methylase UbiE